MNIGFILVASGHVTMPRINVALMAHVPESAKVEAQAIVIQLHKAGYFHFTLYDASRKDNNLDIEIATFRVAEREPQVLMD